MKRLDEIGDIPENALLVPFNVVGLYHLMWWVYIRIYPMTKVSKLCGGPLINVKTNRYHRKVKQIETSK